MLHAANRRIDTNRESGFSVNTKSWREDVAITNLANGQTSSNLSLSYGDTLNVNAGSSAQSPTLNGSLAILNVASGGQVTGAVINSGFATIYGGGVATNTTLSASGYLYADAGSTINGLVATNAKNIAFDNGVITSGLSLSLNSAIDLYGLAYAAGATASLDRTTDVLTISSNGSSYTLHLTGSYAGETFAVSEDDGFQNLGAFSGTLVTVTQASPAGLAGAGLAGAGLAGAGLAGAGTVGTGTGGTGTVGSTGSGSNTSGTVSAGGSTTNSGSSTVTVAPSGAIIAAGPNTVLGGAGATVVSTTGTGATVIGGAGALTDYGGSGSNTVYAGTGGLTYYGGSGFDTVVGLGKPMTVTGGSGGGQFFGGGGATITAGAGGALNVEIGGNGDALYAAGPSGVLFGTVGGDLLMSSANDSGTSVFFGANGSGRMTFITGAGNDLLALGQGTNVVTLGAGHDTIFGNGRTTSVSTITAGSGSLDMAFSGASTVLNITAGAGRSFNLYAYAAGADSIHLSGFSATEAANAIATQRSMAGGTQLTLSDTSVISLIGVGHATSALFS
jgi:hypothetical protein